tara:strand:+ start:924 stop:1277 length:354 start_codon:yes stop_codon:yes gene_type:complete
MDYDENYDFEEFQHYEVPRLKIDSMINGDDFELLLATHDDEFYRRIVEFCIGKLEGTIQHETLAIVIDEDDEEFQLELPSEGYIKSLTRANEFFINIEEYETCDLIKQLITTLENEL